MADDRGPMLFALGPAGGLGERTAAHLGIRLARHELREFGGGEHKARPLDEVAERDVYVLQGLNGDLDASANDKLVRLLFFIGALKDAGARRVTAVAPYLAYSRKDRRTKPRDPVATRYVAALFESVDADRIVTVEVHNVAAFENAFRSCRPVQVPVAGLLAEHFAATAADAPLAIVSPDAGGAKRAELLRNLLEARLGRPIGKAIMDKHRSMGIVSGSLFAGDVAGSTAIIVDDLIVSGTTIIRAAAACRAAGATRVVAAAAHALFTPEAPIFGTDGPDEIVVTDCIPVDAGAKLTVVGIGGLLGDVIARLHSGAPVSELIAYD